MSHAEDVNEQGASLPEGLAEGLADGLSGSLSAWLDGWSGPSETFRLLALDMIELPGVTLKASRSDSGMLVQAVLDGGRIFACLEGFSSGEGALLIAAELATDTWGLGEILERPDGHWLRFDLNELRIGDGFEEASLYGAQAMLVEAHDRGEG